MKYATTDYVRYVIMKRGIHHLLLKDEKRVVCGKMLSSFDSFHDEPPADTRRCKTCDRALKVVQA